MFSPPAQNFDALDLGNRTSRRRQRPLSSELLSSEPKSKRLRSAFSHKNSSILETTPETQEKNVKSAAVQVMKDVLPGRDLAVRGKKLRSGDREHKGDGSTILSLCDMYTVMKLPALPDRLRSESEKRAPQHGAIYSRTGYALLLTHSHAIVWLYSVNATSPETFLFSLNQSLKNATDPLPVGSLVSTSTSSAIPGLVVVIPSIGKVVFWESIASAATYDLRLQRNGLEFSIPGLSSGEHVTQLLNAESAGFILAFSSGRIAYLSVRDGQGRPAISVQFLRAGSAALTAGIFGSIRNALSSSALRGDIAAVRAGPAEKVGERDVFVATKKGKFQYWRIHRGGHTSISTEFDVRETITAHIKPKNPDIGDKSLESFELLDFTFMPKIGEAASQPLENEEEKTDLLILSSFFGRHRTSYYLVNIVMKRNELEVRNSFPIRSYTTPVNWSATLSTRIYVPKPGLVGFIVFDQAVVILSLAKPNSQKSQNRVNSHFSPRTFDDVIDFQHGMDVEIVGSGIEEPHELLNGVDSKSLHYKAKHPAVILLVRGGVVVRISATDIAKLTTSESQQVTAKTKLEQAVFYGSLEQNPLSFSVRPELKFPNEEFGAAAAELSDEILGSKTPHISSVAASIDQNLQKRSTALRNLANFLHDNGINLSRSTKWKLLTDAEKMKAAMLVWKRFDAAMKNRRSGEKRGLLTEVIESIHENYKTEPVPEAGELDRIRHWFVNDIWNMELAVPWAYQVIKNVWQDDGQDLNFVLQMLSEANDLVICTLLGAFEFRAANLDLYGLSSEQLEHGVLVTGYEGIPEFWTSTTYITENTRKQSSLSAILLDQVWGNPNEKIQSPVLLSKIRSEYGSLVDITIRSNTERIRWCSVQDSSKLKVQAQEIINQQTQTQGEQISVLASTLGLPDEAMNLAEKHRLLDVLASLIKLDLDACAHMMKSKFASEKLNDLIARQKYLRSRIQLLFLKFGSNWAKALFETYIKNRSFVELLDSMQENQTHLTSFLRSKPEYSKISWINDVSHEKDFDQASKALLQLGLKHEQDSWCKKIALSIGKLSLLASQPQDDMCSDNPQLESVDGQLGLIRIQEEIYEYVLPAISNAIDKNAELQLALEAYENKALERQPYLQSVLKERISSLIEHKAMCTLELVDLLTLIDTGPYEENGSTFCNRQFYLALKAISQDPPRSDYLLTQRTIWRRCMLRDDWVEINNTKMKDDDSVSAQSRATILYQTLKMCFQSCLFEKDSNIRAMSPLDVLGAGTENLDHRYKRLDVSIQNTIIKEMLVEDNALKSLVDTCRLDQWHKTVLDYVILDREKELSKVSEKAKKVLDASQKLAALEERLKKNENYKL